MVNVVKVVGVFYIVYISFVGVDKFISVLVEDYFFIEKVIEKFGIVYIFLCNNWYFENEMLMIGGVLSVGKFVYVVENGKVGWVLKCEYVEVVVKVVVGVDFLEIFELFGLFMIYEEFIKVLKEVIGKDFDVIFLDDKGFVENLVFVGLL